MVRRAYYMRGLGDLGGALTHEAGVEITEALLANGYAHAAVGEWTDLQRFLADALEHPEDFILLSGHSMGCKASFDGAPKLMQAKIKVRVVGLDPLCTGPFHPLGLDATVIWGNACGVLGPVPGARNIYLPAGPHVSYPNQPQVQAAFIKAATAE